MWPKVYGQMVTTGRVASAPQPPPERDVVALLVAAGIMPVSEVRECKDARRRSATGQSWIVVLPKGAKIPADVWAKFEPNAFRDGQILIVELRRVG